MKNHFAQLTDESVLGTFPKEVQSKVVLGASKLSEEDFVTARSLFEQSIALDHQCGAAWIGKAYAEAYLNFSDGHNYIPTIDHSLEVAKKSLGDGESVLNHQARVLELLIGRITDELLTKLDLVRKSEIQAQKARNEAAISALVTVVAAEVGSSSKSTTGKVLGYGTAAAAGANTVASLSRASELSAVAGSVFGVLLTQCYLSSPLLRQADEHKTHFPEPFRQSVTQAIIRWRAAVADCYNLQISRLKTSLEQLRAKVSASDALKASGEFDEGFQANCVEVSALRLSAQMFGLNEHSSYAKLDVFLSEIESTLQSEQAKQDFKTAKMRRIIAICVSAAVTVFAFSQIGESEKSSQDFFVPLDLIGFAATFIFYKWKGLFKAQTQKKLGATTKEFAKYVQNVKVSSDDIVLSRIKGDVEATFTGFGIGP